MNFWNSRSEDILIPSKQRMEAKEKASTNNINNQIKFSTHPFIPPSFNRNIVKNPLKNSIAHKFPFNLPCRDLSDKYDPFMSAKRQMEELFMPTASYASPTQRTTLPNSTTGVGTMSTSFTGSSASNHVTPKTSTNTTQFRRTASLRVPKKKISKPVLTLPTMTSTIQRGISVEGPVSSSFLKPEEYDEIPVKCHTIVSPKLAPSKEASPRRDIRQATPPDSARGRAVANYNILKADSLATFLKYEDEVRNESPCLSEKERKDKSNSLNRQTLFQQSFHDINENRMEPSPPSPEPSIIQHQNSNEHDNSPEPPQHSEAIDSNLSTPSSEYNYLFVDPKLINSCDNLNVDEPDLVTDSNANNDDDDTINFTNLVDKYEPQPTQRSSVEKRSLKRHIKLNKENFLYDNDASDKDHIDRIDNAEKEPQPERSVKDGIEALFHDFDFEEFISSFEDDDKYPIFKGYKELMSSRSNMHHSKDTMLKNFNELRIDDEILDFNNAADEMRSSNATSSGLYTKDDRIEPHRNVGRDIDECIKADTNASSLNMFSFTRNDTAKSNTDSAYSRLVRCFGTCNVFIMVKQSAYSLVAAKLTRFLT